MDTHEVLVDARNRVEREHACVTNATFYACKWDIGLQRQAHQPLLDILGLGHPEPVQEELDTLRDWHDAPERTRAEVLAAFDEAIRRTAPQPDFSSLENIDYSEEAVKVP